MSGSPKYSCAEIATTIVEQISSAVEELRAAEAERARRRAEEQYRREVDSTRTVLLSEIQALATSLHEHRQASYAQWATGLARPSEVEFLARTAESATDLCVLESVRHQMNAAATSVRRVVVSAQKAEQVELARQDLERQHADALVALASVERVIAETDPQLAAKFDPAGAEEVRRMLSLIATAIGAERFDEAMAHADACTASSKQHRERVLRAEQEWLEKRETARAGYHETASLLRAARGDRIVMAWRKDGMERLADTLAGATQAIDREAWDTAATILKDVCTQLARFTSEAVKREEEEAQRRYIARSVIAVLNEQGFHTDVPQLLSDDLNSDVIIQAVRSDQRSLQIGIQRQGRVRYEVDGASRVLTPAPGGKVIQECPDSESAILALHKQLERDFGIEMDDLSWDGKPLDILNATACEASVFAGTTGKGCAL